MIVGDFNVVSVVLSPSETDSVPVVDADAVLSQTISTQLFQTVSRRDFQVVQFQRGVQHGQLSPGRACGKSAFGFAAFPDFRRAPVGESLDHCLSIMERVNNVNRYY